jgi:hypothetical protein
MLLLLLLQFSSSAAVIAVNPGPSMSSVSCATLNLLDFERNARTRIRAKLAHQACASASAEAFDGAKSPPSTFRDIFIDNFVLLENAI